MGLELTTIEITLTPDARIISENDTHAVVAVLIEKAWLKRNMHFLAALADYAADPAIAGPPETSAPVRPCVAWLRGA